MDSGNACGPDGRLPDASLDQKHLRDIFYRMARQCSASDAVYGGCLALVPACRWHVRGTYNIQIVLCIGFNLVARDPGC